ncbi:hypothetical protein DL766_006095 [Monosporascus sp. MC13-8B]|uniref:Uncharacterized protein n=1 Tax=Monosporascus cannonballus TaxID=155416 RepID=A0ABY0HAI6_9PEZI|nr:hypothetical protein DL763_009186 [Monosporascus cannonballus]RYO85955.1 hypothetical protein DL762_004972 [Monosporascus cannonballus]RYP28026.1 hypothetical protein DL766_006095 [Monosporascus sp. MC13-8B]
MYVAARLFINVLCFLAWGGREFKEGTIKLIRWTSPIAVNVLGTAGARTGKAAFVVTLIGEIMGVAEVGFAFALRKARREHVEWPMTLMAMLSAVAARNGHS